MAAAAVAAAAAGPSALVSSASLGAAYIPGQPSNSTPPGAVPTTTRGRGSRKYLFFFYLTWLNDNIRSRFNPLLRKRSEAF
jgi:hypothetical protein